MVDTSNDASKQHIGSSDPTGLDADPATARPTNFKMLQEALLNEYSLNVNKANDCQDNAQGQSDTVDALLQRLQSAINDENDLKAQEVSDMKEMLVTYEQSLAKMIKFGKDKDMQDGAKTMIDKLCLDIEKLEAQNKTNQAVYKNLMQEMKAKLEQRI